EQGATFALPVAAVALVAVIWFINVPGITAASQLVQAINFPSSADATTINSHIAIFQSLVKHPAFAPQEVREQLVSFATSIAQSSAATTEQKTATVSRAIQEMQKELAAHPKDARERLELALAY